MRNAQSRSHRLSRISYDVVNYGVRMSPAHDIKLCVDMIQHMYTPAHDAGVI